MKKLFAILGMLFFACEGPSGTNTIPADVSPPIHKNVVVSNSDNPETGFDRQIVKEGHIRFESSEPDSTASSVKRAVKRFNGRIVNEEKEIFQIRRGEKEISYRMDVKIPSNRLDAFLNELDKIAGNYDFKNLRSRDVTRRHTDLQARLKAKKALQARLTELLQQARNVDEIIRLEKELARLQAEIESLEGQLRYLNDKVAYAKLHIEFYKRIITSPRFLGRMAHAFKNGLVIFQEFLLLIINLWIFILLALLAFWWWRKHKRLP